MTTPTPTAIATTDPALPTPSTETLPTSPTRGRIVHVPRPTLQTWVCLNACWTAVAIVAPEDRWAPLVVTPIALVMSFVAQRLDLRRTPTALSLGFATAGFLLNGTTTKAVAAGVLAVVCISAELLHRQRVDAIRG